MLGDPVVEREERRLPAVIARNRIDIVQRDEVLLFEAFDDCRSLRTHEGERQVGRGASTRSRLSAQAACSRWLLPAPGGP